MKRQTEFLKSLKEKGVAIQVQGDNVIGVYDNIPTPANKQYVNKASRAGDKDTTVGIACAVGFMHTYQAAGEHLLQLQPQFSPRNDAEYKGEQVHLLLEERIFCDEKSEKEYFENEIWGYMHEIIKKCRADVANNTSAFLLPADDIAAAAAAAANEGSECDFQRLKYCEYCGTPHPPGKGKCDFPLGSKDGKLVRGGCQKELPPMSEYMKRMEEKKSGRSTGSTFFPGAKPNVYFGKASIEAVDSASAVLGALAPSPSSATFPKPVVRVSGQEAERSKDKDSTPIQDRVLDGQRYQWEQHLTVPENPNSFLSIQRVIRHMGETMQVAGFVKYPKRAWAGLSADIGAVNCCFCLLDDDRKNSPFGNLRFQMPLGHEEWSGLKCVLLLCKVYIYPFDGERFCPLDVKHSRLKKNPTITYTL